MTRKDYVMLALALRAARPSLGDKDRFAWARCVQSIANTLQNAIPGFDRARFVANCAGHTVSGVNPDE